MIVLPAPAALAGEQLSDELHAAGLSDTRVVLVGDDLEVHGIEDRDRDTVERVVAAHTPPVEEPVEPLTGDEITCLRAMLAGR